jgi:hypothetical protein
VEIDYQAERDIEEFHVAQKAGFVNRCHRFACLYLN